MRRRMSSDWIARLVLCLCISSGAAPADVGPWVYDTWKTFSTDDGLPSNHIRAVHLSGAKVWVGTDVGLAMREGNVWRSWTVDDGLPWPAVSAIDTDPRTGEVWLGTWGGGIARFSGGRFDGFNQFNSALAGNFVFDLKVFDNRVWIATNGGISAFDTVKGEWKLYAERRGDRPDIAVADLCAQGDALHAASWTADILRFDSQCDRWAGLEPDSSEPTLLPHGVLAMSSTADSLWAVTRSAFWRRLEDGAWTRFPVPDLWGADNTVQCVAAADENILFVGTDRGLHAMVDPAGNTWVTYRSAPRESSRVDHPRGTILAARGGLPDDRVRCLAATEDGVWVGTVNGLAYGTHRAAPDSLRAGGALRATSSLDVRSPERIEIAFVGPATRTISRPSAKPLRPSRVARPDLLAIQLAVERANSQGGYRDQVAFTLVSAPEDYVFSHYGWGMLEDEYYAISRRATVCGLIAHLDPGSRASTLAVLRTEAPLINASIAPPTLDETITPWVFRAPRNRRGNHRVVLDYIFDTLGYTRIAVLHTGEALSRRHLDDWMTHVTRRGHSVVAELYGMGSADDAAEQWAMLRSVDAEVVLTWSDAKTSAEFVQRMREANMPQLVVGSDAMLRGDFATLVGVDPGSVCAATPCWGHEGAAGEEWFTKRYADRGSVGRAKKNRPGRDALASFHSANLLIKAVNIAGADRWRLQGTLRDLRRAQFASLEDGVWIFHADE